MNRPLVFFILVVSLLLSGVLQSAPQPLPRTAPTKSVNDFPVPNKLPPTLAQSPDLQVKSLELVGTQARIRVANTGQGAAGPFNVQLLASQPSKVSGIVAIFDHQVAGVPPMTSIPIVIDVAPKKLSAGNVTVHLDSKNEVKESSETNNSASK